MRRYIYLLLIILLAGVIRLWQLGVVPSSPDWDEAALGYNAYSVLKTGRDEYGTWFPLSLRSYDDYKPPLYMYLTVPSVALFGLETWAVRLPSAIMGILAVAGTYFLVKELYKKYKDYNGYNRYIALLSALLLAISPWNIQFSRIAFEANIGVTINIWAVWAFFKGLHQRKMLVISAFLFGLGLYAYHSERIFVPLLVLLLSWIYRKELLEQKRSVLMAAIVGVLTVAPLLTVFLNPTAITRLRGTSSLADQTGLLAKSVRKLEEDQQTGNPWGVVFDNRRIVWAKTLMDGYLSHFSLRWLFVTGDNPRHHAPDMGLLYLVELPFLLWGMIVVGKHGGKLAKILFSWFLLAPVAASPTTELPHAIRTLVFLPTFQIFTAFGILQAARWFGQNKHSFFIRLFSYSIILLFAINITYYTHMYFIHQNSEVSDYWQYGYKQAVEYAQKEGALYTKVVVSTKLEQPHMFFLYFLKYDPAVYLSEGGTSSGGFAEVRNRFGRFEFRPIDWGKENKDGHTLYIGTPKEISVANLLTINYLDGKEAIRIADR
ncbi:glycosyltransferase family 39 protein [Candidatus Gottesmanbacteria bacterium]|nr:glycosyltransferase family 39 protein [Candidatus Gottesmanbacteria bacterium]